MSRGNGRFRCLTIGYIEARKGQDVLVRAVGLLPEEIRRDCEFLLIGQDTSLLAQELKRRAIDIPEIRVIGTVGREEIHRLLEESDLLILPSREDPMPTVAAEAMMHSLPCIVSDHAGTAGYLTDGLDGFIFKSEDSRSLAEKIGWCFRHREAVREAGKHARMLYQKVFSMETFEKNLLALVNEMRL